MKNRTIIGIICIAAALVIAFAVLPAVTGRMNGSVSAVRLRNSVAGGRMLTADDLETVRVGALNLPSGLISDPSAAVGRYAAGDLFAGDLLTVSKIREKSDGAADSLSRLGDSELAVTVAVSSFAGGFSGQLTNGDLVKIFVVDRDGSYAPEELDCVRVITTVTGDATLRDSAGVDGQDGMSLPATIMFAVNAEQAALLFGFANRASVCCAFICHASDAEAGIRLSRQREWFEKRDAEAAAAADSVAADSAAAESGAAADALSEWAEIIGGDLPQIEKEGQKFQEEDGGD